MTQIVDTCLREYGIITDPSLRRNAQMLATVATVIAATHFDVNFFPHYPWMMPIIYGK